MSYNCDWFIKRLKEIDPKLGSYFCPFDHLVVVTYERAVGPPAKIYVVSREDGDFREPDQRDINAILDGDLSKDSLSNRLSKAENYMTECRQKQEASQRTQARELALDDKYQLARAFSKVANPGGKQGRHVRTITPRQRGVAF